mgnify:CR=1 FL=1
MSEFNTDFLIIGSGMVGLTLAYQLKKNYPNQSITIIEKESSTGKHSSGRNSGVIHAGIYYKPNSLKAKVCVEGAQRLIQWCDKENVPLLRCGKIILPQTIKLDSQIDYLLNRGIQNGAQVSIINKDQLNQKISDANHSARRALWSPNTCVVDPLKVLFKLVENLKNQGINFLFDSKINDEIENEISRAINKEKEFIKSMSPKYWANKIKNKVFIMHGSNDSMVPFTESIELHRSIEASSLFVSYMYEHKEISTDKGIIFKVKEFYKMFKFFKGYFKYNES